MSISVALSLSASTSESSSLCHSVCPSVVPSRMQHSMRSHASGFLKPCDLNLRIPFTVFKRADDPDAPCAGSASVAADLVFAKSTARSGVDGVGSEWMTTGSHVRSDGGADVFAGLYHSEGAKMRKGRAEGIDPFGFLFRSSDRIDSRASSRMKTARSLFS